MDSMRKTALVAGVFYLITFISIPTLALYSSQKNHRDWILSSGAHTGVLVGGFLEVIVALACIGTAVTLYPVLKRQNEGAAPGFVAARVLDVTAWTPEHGRAHQGPVGTVLAAVTATTAAW